jgi:hypothetical protein
MQTFERVRERIQANMPKAAPSRSETLQWSRETAASIVTTDNRFRITRQIENGTATYWAQQCATHNSAPKPVGGRFMSFDQAREAVEFIA